MARPSSEGSPMRGRSSDILHILVRMTNGRGTGNRVSSECDCRGRGVSASVEWL